MAEESNVILGVSLGTRTIGLAVGNRNGLINWYMKVFLGTYSRKKVRKIWRVIDQAFDRYGITTIGMKLPHPSYRSDGLNQCLKEVAKRALAKDIPLCFYDIVTIENYYFKSNVRNKMAVAEKIADKYPFLKNEFYRLKENKKYKYYEKVFDAVAVMELAIIESL